MDDTKFKFRKQLNDNQLALLELLFRYRFGGVKLLTVACGKKDESVVFRSLGILERQGYVAKRYESDYKLQGKPAAYYLLPKALKVLRERDYQKEITDAVIKNSYRDRIASEGFMMKCLTIFALANHLSGLYPDLELFTRSELTTYTYLPEPLPDAFLSLEFGSTTKRYLLEYIEDRLPPIALETRIKQLITYYQDDDWGVTKSPFPPILCVCESGKLEKRLSRQISRALFRNDNDAPFYTTTVKAVLSANAASDTVWSSVAEPDELLALEAIP